VLDLKARLLSMNAEGRKRLGIKRFSSFAETPWADLWKNETSEFATAAVMKARRGETARSKASAPTVSGTPKWWDVIVTPVLDAEGKPCQFLAVLRDITEGRAPRTNFRILFEHSANAQPDLRRKRDYRFQPGLRGTAARAPQGRADRALPGDISPAAQPDGTNSAERLKELTELALSCGSFRYEWEHQRADGELFPVEVSLTAVELNGRPVLLAVWHDLTSAQAHEAALRESEERFSRS